LSDLSNIDEEDELSDTKLNSHGGHSRTNSNGEEPLSPRKHPNSTSFSSPRDAKKLTEVTTMSMKTNSSETEKEEQKKKRGSALSNFFKMNSTSVVQDTDLETETKSSEEKPVTERKRKNTLTTLLQRKTSNPEKRESQSPGVTTPTITTTVEFPVETSNEIVAVNTVPSSSPNKETKLEEKIKKLSKENEKLSKEIDSLEKELMSYQKRIVELQDLISKNSLTLKEFQFMEEQNEILEKEKVTLIQELETLKLEYSSGNNKKEEISQEKFDLLNSQIKMKENSIQDLEDKYTRSMEHQKIQRINFEEQVKVLKENKEMILNQLMEKENELDLVQQKYNKMKKINQKLTENYESMKEYEDFGSNAMSQVN
jgi:DNA repair exonuclease SbcCD ATPase subunit